jgi:flagellar protein FliO/FliZ
MKKNVSYSFLVFALGNASSSFAADTPVVMPSANAAIVQTVLALALVVGFIYLLAWLLKRLNMHGVCQQKSIKILTVASLGAREKAILINVDGKKMLLGVAPGRVSTLHVFESLDTDLEQEPEDRIEQSTKVSQSLVVSKGMVSSLAARSASDFSKKLNEFLGSGNKSE